MIAAAKELKKSLMKYLFNYGPVPVDQAEKWKLKDTEFGFVPEEWEISTIIDDNILKMIEENQASDTERVFNLLKSIQREIKDKVHIEPFLKSIGEKAELIAELYKSGQKRILVALKDLKKSIEEINMARKEQKQMNLPKEIFSIYWVMKNESIPEPEQHALQMKDTLETYPFFKSSSAHELNVKQKLYAVLLKAGLSKEIKKAKTIVEIIMRILKSSQK